jgi:hypothetical protein
MVEVYDYRRLRELQHQERDSSALVSLPAEFYSSIFELVAKKRLEVEKSHSLHEIKEYENMLKVIKDLHAMRTRKVVFRALGAGHKHETAGMTKEEHALYDSVCGLLEGNGSLLESAVASQSLRPPHEPVGIKKLRILKEIPAFKGADNSVYGPYKPGEEQELPPSEAEILLRGKLAETI